MKKIKPTTINYQKLVVERLDTIISLLETKNSPMAVPDLDSDKYIKLEMKDYMTPKYLWSECQKLFPCWIYSESYLDGITSDRTGDYTVYFKNVQEADEENKNLSANDLKKKGIEGITLEERLFMEIEYFKKTGQHLDIKSVTICSGSRDRDGDVSSSGWSGGRFEVGWFDAAGDRHDDWRARSVVSSER